MFSESSTVVMQLPCCPGKQGKVSEICFQNLQNDLMVESVKFVTYFCHFQLKTNIATEKKLMKQITDEVIFFPFLRVRSRKMRKTL